MTDIISSDDDSDLTGGSYGSSFDDAAPLAADAYTEGYNRTGDHNGKGAAWKW